MEDLSQKKSFKGECNCDRLKNTHYIGAGISPCQLEQFPLPEFKLRVDPEKKKEGGGGGRGG